METFKYSAFDSITQVGLLELEIMTVAFEWGYIDAWPRT